MQAAIHTDAHPPDANNQVLRRPTRSQTCKHGVHTGRAPTITTERVQCNNLAGVHTGRRSRGLRRGQLCPSRSRRRTAQQIFLSVLARCNSNNNSENDSDNNNDAYLITFPVRSQSVYLNVILQKTKCATRALTRIDAPHHKHTQEGTALHLGDVCQFQPDKDTLLHGMRLEALTHSIVWLYAGNQVM